MIRHLMAVAVLALVGSSWAQEGHPLVGSWHGTWGPTAAERHDITVILYWDGKAITGMVNPGPDAMKIENASLNPAAGWVFHFEGNLKSAQGKTERVVAEGKIENISNVRRTVAGTWTQGSAKGDFRIARDN